MATLGVQLDIDRCPHCAVAVHLLSRIFSVDTEDVRRLNYRQWSVYQCSRCGGCVLAATRFTATMQVSEQYPQNAFIDDDAIPKRATAYLNQAIDSIQAPAGAVMLTASSVDAMLKEKGYKTGSLYDRINKAATDHVITKDMATWAHEVRLDANDQRHADDKADLPSEEDAIRVIEFARALATFLFVLPARVTRGIKDATKPKGKHKNQ